MSRWIFMMSQATTKVVKRVLGEKGSWGYDRYGVGMGNAALWIDGANKRQIERFVTFKKWGPAAMIELHKMANDWLERDWTKQMVAEQEGKRYRRKAGA